MSNAFAGVVTSAPTFTRRVEQASFLIVDDFDSMRRITANQLRQLGAKHIMEAANGAEALRLLERESITMVLSDWNMPIMSGLELLLAVRANPKLQGLPFVMITAEAERDRVQQAITAGVSELLVKPYTAGRFAERLERAMMRKVSKIAAPVAATAAMPAPAAVAPAAAASPAVMEKPTILVVDDTPDNLHLLAQIFKEEYRVKIAHNGERALAICQSDTPPDLLLLDVMMPDMNGFEVAEKLRSHPSSEHIPIIFVTALSDEESRLKGMSLGAVDFVTKPVDPGTLHLRVKNFMRYIGLHQQLQADYDTMLEAARLKEDVEHMTRHDMKAPLAGVIGLVQDLIENSSLRSEQCEQLRMIEEAALQALNLINLSSEIYKIETGRFQLKPQPVAMLQIVRRLAEMAEKTFAVKSLEITVVNADGQRESDLVASGDSMFCYSLLQNLLKNACEAAPKHGRISITLSASEVLNIAIENPGAVPVAMRERFFEKFATADKDGGTGLGTYSAKLLTEAQGGTIAMDTEDNKNTTRVVVTLPLNKTN